MQIPSLYKNLSKRTIFWIIQILTWAVYFIYHLIVNSPFLLKDNRIFWPLIFWLLLFSYFGIPLTMALSIIFKIINKKLKSIYLYVFSVLILSFLFANIWFLFMMLLDYLFKGQTPSYAHYVYPVETSFAFIALSAWSAVYLFIKFWDDWAKQKQHTANALILAENARLKMLQNQLNPHFLFNSLSSLRALIRTDKSQAIEMLNKISEFLKYSLINKSNFEVTLKEEINAAKDYFGIEQVRFREKLIVKYNIDAVTENIKIPALILHPIIENAVKYGMNNSKMPLEITIITKLINNKLCIIIENTGSWINSGSENGGTSTGLQNVRDRLNNIYPENNNFYIEKLNGKVIVFIKIQLDKNKRNENN